MLMKLRRLMLYVLWFSLACLVMSTLAFLLTAQAQLLPMKQVANRERDPFPWEVEGEDGGLDDFRGPKRNLQTALVSEDAFTQPQTHPSSSNVSTALTTQPPPSHKRSTQHSNHVRRIKYNYTVVQQARQMALDYACREQTITREGWQDLSPAQRSAVGQRIMVDDSHKLLFCPVPLTAIGPWTKVMYMLGAGKNLKDMTQIPTKELTNKDNFAYLSSYSASQQEEMVATYLKFMVTRHPFLRVAAAYKMKFEADNVFFHERYGKEIIQLYRPGTARHESGSDVKFTEFVDYLLHLEEEAEMNEHWQPLHVLCRPCEVGYDYILHYETLAKDAGELLAEGGLLSRVPALPTDTWDYIPIQYVNDAFKQLTPAWVGRLVQRYQEDFAMFSYGSLF